MSYLVNAPDPMLLLRVPDDLPWPTILKALSPTPRPFYYLHIVDVDKVRERLEAAFSGGNAFADYALYDWREGGFVLVRGTIG